MQRRRVVRIVLWTAVGAVLVLLVLRPGGGPDLEPWHRLAPASELDADRAPSSLDLDEYLRIESEVFAELDRLLEREVPDSPGLATSRYSRGGRNDPATFETNWNRTSVRVPAAHRGAALLLHGLTDSPYSLRALGQTLNAHHLATVSVRLPGHGTVPEALDRVEREDWTAAVRAAARHAAVLAGRGPMVLVGYSNGAALALEYALDALDDPALRAPDALVMLSPAIGITRFAALGGLPRLRRYVPFVGRLRWTDLEPEIDPYKYSSFPANAGYQTHRLTVANRERVRRLAADGRAGELPPVLAFVSLADSTVKVESVAADLFEPVADRRSELVVFDVNRFAAVAALFASDPREKLEWLADRVPLAWRLSAVTNASPDSLDVVERTWSPGERESGDRPLGMGWPRGVYSLSHVAVPFPADDPLYGFAAPEDPERGLPLGRLEPRGERGLLTLDMDGLMRLRSNPFYAYVESRVLEWLELEATRESTPANPS